MEIDGQATGASKARRNRYIERGIVIVLAIWLSLHWNRAFIIDRGGMLAFGLLYFTWPIYLAGPLVALGMSIAGLKMKRLFLTRLYFYAVVLTLTAYSLFVGAWQGNQLYDQDKAEVKKYVEALAASVEAYRELQGAYPESLDGIGLDVPVPPHLAHWREETYRRRDWRIRYTEGDGKCTIIVGDLVRFDREYGYLLHKKHWWGNIEGD